MTYPIPQNYIDLDKLKKCLPEFPYAKELAEQNERLFVAPMRMLLILDILNTRRPIGMIYDPYSGLISEHGTVNNHTVYYSIPSEWAIGRTEEYRKGCLGSFEPKMIEAQRLFTIDKIKAIKQYIHLTMQYIQSTNVLDSAGQNNIKYGYYVNSNNIVVHQASDKLKGKNIYDVQYKY